MNRLLLIIAVLLVPVTFVTKRDDTPTLAGSTLESYSLEWEEESEIENKEEENIQVLISSNRDKSNPFYIDLEEYIVGVVAGEMPASFNMEALKAQAVAARTYALYKEKNIKDYVLSTTVSDQVYLSEEEMQERWKDNFSFYYNRVKEAVDMTKGEVLTYNGDIIIAYYFAISNGMTENALNVFNESKEYLVSVDSSWDKNYDAYYKETVIDKNIFCSKLGILGGNIDVSNIVRGDNNYIRSITINGKTFTGREIYNKLGLRSTDFTLMIEGNNVRIKTYGYGHSVGMSQYGAEGMASSGYNYQDILKHYYQNTEIEKI